MNYSELIQKQAEFEAMIAAIDTSVAGRDEYGDLAWHVDCSARANAEGKCGAAYFQAAIDTAHMIIDCWEDFYPQLVKHGSQIS